MQQQRPDWVESTVATLLPLPTSVQLGYVICHWCYQGNNLSTECVLAVWVMLKIISCYDELMEAEKVAMPGTSDNQARVALGYRVNGTTTPKNCIGLHRNDAV